jgi:DNA modification methylase
MQTYEELISSKITRHQSAGADPFRIHPSLYPFQKAVVEWAVRLGRAAIFAECGLGKTRMQIEWARHAEFYSGRPVLILAPLAVARQTIEEGAEIGVSISPARGMLDVPPRGIVIANYEMLEHFDARAFGGVVLDESSILKSFDGKTRNALVAMFSETAWKLCCTATPAPNDHTELGNHSEFLGVLRLEEMLPRWFKNDSFDTGTWILKRHAVADFWRWVHSWAVSIGKPSDFGAFDDTGFVLPELVWHQHVVPVDHSTASEGMLFRMPEMSATGIHKEMRLTANDRCALAADLVNRSAEPWIVWCNANYESDILKRIIPDAVEVRGSDSVAIKEQRLNDFSHGRVRAIITKPSIAGFGLNWQHCHNVAFVGLSYSYEQLYQAIRRSWRFGQTMPVQAHVITAASEGPVVSAIKTKEINHEGMKRAMNDAMRSYQTSAATMSTAGSLMPPDIGAGWMIRNGDCVVGMRDVDSDSVGFSVFSPPFSNLFIYSDRIEDMGNNENDEAFFDQFRFCIDELLRVTMPGRLCAVHISDLPTYLWKDGQIGMKDLSGRTIRAFVDAGWIYHSRVCIWKDPVTEMQRTKALGLLYKQLKKDSSMSRVGMPDYVCVFRKPGKNAVPVEQTPENFSLDQWQKWASPVWMDIRQSRVLQFRHTKGDKDERHICPLQLDVIERCIQLWSVPGDLVCSPFAGIGSEGHEAVRLGRKFIGFELKKEYYDEAVRNLKAAEMMACGGLFES